MLAGQLAGLRRDEREDAGPSRRAPEWEDRIESPYVAFHRALSEDQGEQQRAKKLALLPDADDTSTPEGKKIEVDGTKGRRIRVSRSDWRKKAKAELRINQDTGLITNGARKSRLRYNETEGRAWAGAKEGKRYRDYVASRQRRKQRVGCVYSRRGILLREIGQESRCGSEELIYGLKCD
ncbi:hypothetical protein KM043_006430 [Ampulex compressa]|nr:hypothetical protein KM043_006430 [Ampulex compressa]